MDTQCVYRIFGGAGGGTAASMEIKADGIYRKFVALLAGTEREEEWVKLLGVGVPLGAAVARLVSF